MFNGSSILLNHFFDRHYPSLSDLDDFSSAPYFYIQKTLRKRENDAVSVP